MDFQVLVHRKFGKGDFVFEPRIQHLFVPIGALGKQVLDISHPAGEKLPQVVGQDS
jgi:hypothetical protein